MKRVTVGVLRGGPSNEYEVSLKSGATVLAELDRQVYEPKDIFISRQGEWHINGIPATPEKALRSVDVAFNAMHGEYGEDGTVQRLLDTVGVPYTGSGALASALAFNKERTKEVIGRLGIKVPRGLVLDASDVSDRRVLELFRSVPMPVMIKPLVGGSSVGMSYADSYFALEQGIARALAVSPKILIEEYIRGREATGGVVDGFRGEDIYTLFPVEIIPPKTCAFFDYEAKYGGKSQELCPSTFSEREKGEITELSREVHRALGLRHYSRSDFIVSPRGIYFLEVNTLPGLTQESLLPKAIKAVGSKISDFFTHVIDRARR